jgi:tetraacyldisaccharide 4'-kinase
VSRSNLEGAWRALVSGEATDRWAGPARWGLRGLSLPYAAGISAYRALFDLGLFRPSRLAAPVVSIGNITLGGTGKTTTVRWLARRLTEWGRRPAILSRGYRAGAVGPRDVAVVSDGREVLLEAAAGGDEPVLLARSLPGVPVLIGKRRVRSGAEALLRFHPDVLILDDAFQYWRLVKDLEIVLLDAGNPFGGGTVFPGGLLREPLRGLARAHAAVLTHATAASPDQRAAALEDLGRRAPGAVLAEARHVPTALREHATGRLLPLSSLADPAGWLAFSGLGRPDAFARTLGEAGAVGVVAQALPDHFRYGPEDMRALEVAARGKAGMLCTEKDAVKIPPEWVRDTRLLVLEIDLEFLSGEAELNSLLRLRLGMGE